MTAPTFVAGNGPTGFTTTSTSLSYSTGRAFGDIDIVGVIYKGVASNVGTLPGWGTKLLAVAESTNLFLDVYAKVSDGTETGSVGTLTVTGSTQSEAALATYRSSTGVLRVNGVAYGVDSSSGTGYSAASTTSLDTAVDSLIVYILGQTGIGAHSARTLTQTGATFGTLTARFGAAATSIRQEFGDRPVTVAGTGALTFGATLAANATGITGFLRLDEAPRYAAFGIPL